MFKPLYPPASSKTSIILDIFKVIFSKNNLIWPYHLFVPKLCSFLYFVYKVKTFIKRVK